MGALFILLFVLAAMFVPFAVIWAINALLGLQIQFTLFTWLAMLVLTVMLRGRLSFSR